MTEQQARTTANLVMAAAAVGAAVVVVRSPSLRRLAAGLAKASAAPLAAYAVTTVRQAWEVSGSRPLHQRTSIAPRESKIGP